MLRSGTFWKRICSRCRYCRTVRSSRFLKLSVRVTLVLVFVNAVIAFYLVSRSATGPNSNVETQLPTTLDTFFGDVPVRIYRPRDNGATLPGLIYIHGGGWICRNTDRVHERATLFCQTVNVVVISVSYRLAPESTFPAAVDDCVVAAQYFLSHAAEFNVISHRIGVAGESAGGNLAAAVALKLRDVGFEPQLKVQVLLLPILQGLDFQLPSMVKYRQGPRLTTERMAYYVALYLDGNPNNSNIYLHNRHVALDVKQRLSRTHFNLDRLPPEYLEGYQRTDLEYEDSELYERMKDKLLSPYFSPLVAESVSGLPRALVCTGELDPLRDEGFLFVWRLREAGNNVTHVNQLTLRHDINEEVLQSSYDFLLRNL